MAEDLPFEGLVLLNEWTDSALHSLKDSGQPLFFVDLHPHHYTSSHSALSPIHDSRHCLAILSNLNIIPRSNHARKIQQRMPAFCSSATHTMSVILMGLLGAILDAV